MTERRFPPGFWAVWTAVGIDMLGFGIIIPLLPLYAEDYGATPTVIGLLFASYSLGQFVFSPIWGRVSDRVGRKPVLLVTLVGSAIGSLVLGLAATLPVLFVGRIIDGISGASVAVARATVADVASTRDRPRLMGMLGAAFGLGFVVGPALGGLAALGGPAVPFFLAAGIAAVNTVVTAIRLPETLTEGVKAEQRPSLTHSIRTLPNPVVRLVILSFVGLTAFSAFEATFSLLGSDRLGLTESGVALVFAGIGLALVITQGGLVGPAARRLGELNLIRVSLVLNLIGFAALAGADTWATLAPALLVLALGQGLITATLSSAVAGATEPERVGVALGVHQSAGGLARVIGPALGGALFALASGVPYVVAALLTVAILPLVPKTPKPAVAEA